jgi:hypothetical protein
MMNAVTTTAAPLTSDYQATEVGTFYRMFGKNGHGEFKAPNDVEKGCQGILEAVTGSGRAVGTEGLWRMPLSADTAQRSSF